jgi:hypothetical protein
MALLVVLEHQVLEDQTVQMELTDLMDLTVRVDLQVVMAQVVQTEVMELVGVMV